MFGSLELFLQLVDDSALYSMRNATARVRRVSRNEETQKDMSALQLAITQELNQRKDADDKIPF